ncbi:unnamed protein product [Coffea canephora]|uniref:Uncharacterized protein n=1 Tax=Coffea canephora TaxID=49390 RepID=A0A068UAL2_COFCA|nr:unnamed protein product [Coffea canephora]
MVPKSPVKVLVQGQELHDKSSGSGGWRPEQQIASFDSVGKMSDSVGTLQQLKVPHEFVEMFKTESC